MFKKVIGIHGVPRSGTSWCAQLFNSSPEVSLKFQPLFSYAFKSQLDQNSSKADIDKFLVEIYNSDDSFINMRDPDIHKNYPVFDKSYNPEFLVFKHVRYHHILKNLLIKYPEIKLVLIVRNPIEVLNSWINAPREFNPAWVIDNEWKKANLKNQERIEEYFGYDKWKEAAQLFLLLKKQFPQNVYFLKYSELVNDTTKICRQLFEFAGLDFSEATNSFIQESKKRNDDDPNSVFKSKDRKHQLVIPEHLVQEIYNDLEGSNLEQFIASDK